MTPRRSPYVARDAPSESRRRALQARPWTAEARQGHSDEVKQVRIDLSARIDHTNARIGETNDRLAETNDRLASTNDRVNSLEHRQTASEIRLATEIVAVADAVREVRDELRQDRFLRSRVDDHERRIGALESRPRE
jgi:septal ring factor EnvC (AmiA/AmiB activator)